MPSSQPILLRALRWGAIATAALIVVFAGIGWLVSQERGLLGGIIGAGIGGVLLGITVASIAFANRFIESPSYVIVFFAIVLGSWLVKFIAFIVAAVLLRDQPLLDPTVLFFGIITGVLVSVGIDVAVVAKSRIPVVTGAP
ncbi:3-oxoacyl-ACP reductase [Leucobacter massiliensis]|uniref:3-oxoacyl-ACP reductase n=2 Tax=Leucobacter massiliensis TaxID=1686285 RepID=A0A2S9QKR5_9MICO|nr:3-oxoacyl-ACP reductase [Leucobacter massiliensis]